MLEKTQDDYKKMMKEAREEARMGTNYTSSFEEAKLDLAVLERRIEKGFMNETSADRFNDLIELLEVEGGLIDIEEDDEGGLTVYKRSCPFIGMYEEDGTVCCLDQEMMSKVVGVPVVRTTCRHEGAPCCSFELGAGD